MGEVLAYARHQRIGQLLNPTLKIEGLLRTMYDPRIGLTNDVSAQLKQHFADQLYRVKPEDEMLRNLSVALIHGIEPARTAGADGIAAERERVQAQREQTDAGEGLAAEAMNRVAAR